jgi:hypothetical protein
MNILKALLKIGKTEELIGGFAMDYSEFVKDTKPLDYEIGHDPYMLKGKKESGKE